MRKNIRLSFFAALCSGSLISSHPSAALDVKSIINEIIGQKEYAAYSCPNFEDAKACDNKCNAWTEPKISFKLDEAKNTLIIKWIDSFHSTEKCSILNKNNWQCETNQMTYRMTDGRLTRIHILNLSSSTNIYYACFK